MLCHPDAVRHDHGALVALLKLRFAPHETVNSLSAEFYARVQLDGETCQPRLAAPVKPARAASWTKPNPQDGSCFYCRERGHFIRECPKKTTPSMPVTRRGRSCFGCKQEGHFVRDCPRNCGDVASGGPEQGNALVSHLTSDRVVRVLSLGETQKLAAEDRIVELEGRWLEAETLEVQLRQQVVSLQAGQEQTRVPGEEQHMVANENLEVSRKHRHWLAVWRQPHHLVSRKASTYRWCRKSHDSACL